MVKNRVLTHCKIVEALDKYHESVANKAFSERDVDDIFDEIGDQVPHANLNDLYFFGESERTHEEIAREALHREHLWQTGGDLALLLYLQSQMEAALADPKTEWLGQRNAKRTLDEVTADIARIKAETMQ
jgi:replicative DNA helicase